MGQKQNRTYNAAQELGVYDPYSTVTPPGLMRMMARTEILEQPRREAVRLQYPRGHRQRIQHYARHM